MLKDLKEKIKEYWLWIVVIIIGIIAAFCIFYFSKNNEQAGLIGDTLSGVFTSLAFICAIFAVALQRKELSLQRKELEQTRTELENQKKEFQIQNQTLKRQQFENTFFNMLSRQENIIVNIRTTTGKIGRDAIMEISKIFVREIELKKLNTKEQIIEFYNKQPYLYTFDHYYRHLYRIIKFVDVTNFNDNEKYNYVAILRATLSCEELVLLFYNALCYPKMKDLIIKYSFLQNIRIFSNTIQHFKYYSDDDFKAFGNSKEKIKINYKEATKK